MKGGVRHGRPAVGWGVGGCRPSWLASSSLKSCKTARAARIQTPKRILPTLSIHVSQPSHKNLKCSFCILFRTWMANKPKEIKIETWQAGPSYTGKNNIYLINSVPKQQSTSLAHRAVPLGVCVCMNMCTYMHNPKYTHTYVCTDKHTDLPPTENIYSYSYENQTALLSPNPANIKSKPLYVNTFSLLVYTSSYKGRAAHF